MEGAHREEGRRPSPPKKVGGWAYLEDGLPGPVSG